MAYLIDNEPFYFIQPQADVSGNQQCSKFAFVLDLPVDELPADQLEQLQKIVKSVQQEPTNTCFLLSHQAWSINALKQKGVKHVVVFAAHPLTAFQSIVTTKHKPFRVSEIDFFMVSDLLTFQKSDTEKKLLWGFMKAKLG